jgi:hypothetical protein
MHTEGEMFFTELIMEIGLAKDSEKPERREEVKRANGQSFSSHNS